MACEVRRKRQRVHVATLWPEDGSRADIWMVITSILDVSASSFSSSFLLLGTVAEAARASAVNALGLLDSLSVSLMDAANFHELVVLTLERIQVRLGLTLGLGRSQPLSLRSGKHTSSRLRLPIVSRPPPLLTAAAPDPRVLAERIRRDAPLCG